MASTCDICGKAVAHDKLVQLLTIYQVNSIVDICPDCEKWANTLKQTLISGIASHMKQAILVKARPETTTPPWWKRIVL